LAIDAHPRGPRGSLAAEPLDGRSVLDHHLDLAEALSHAADRGITIHAPVADHATLRTILDRRPSARHRLSTTAAPAPTTAGVLRVDRLYDRGRLRRLLARQADLDRAAIWRLDTPVGLAGAHDELIRRRSYQPLGHYWARTPATWLARRLVATRVRPNHLTLAAFSLFVIAAGIIGLGRGAIGLRLAAATALALALVLDTADGHLARLQGTASAFGRWLDGWLDEVGEMALHAAIAWSAYVQSGAVGWLVVGMLYAMGKYVFVAGSVPVAGQEPGEAAATPTAPHPSSRPVADLVRLAGHADIRWHLWIVLAAVGWLPAALGVYAVYFPLRAVISAVRKGVAHA
jgi:phosphatidylglycerophosphate synthase